MVQINFAKREINCKLVYYGPGLSGKTTNLEVVHKKAPASKKGELTSIATEGDRTLFFDYMPLELGKVGGMNTKFQLYTVPGQVYYNATRKLVLQGADGVVFVADSQPEKIEENIESFQNLEDNLKEQGLKLSELPLVVQWNKRDLPNAVPTDQLSAQVNKYNSPTFEAVAVTGEGVFPTLKKLAQMVLEKLNREYGLQNNSQTKAAQPQTAKRQANGPPRAAVATATPPPAAPPPRPTPPPAPPPAVDTRPPAPVRETGPRQHGQVVGMNAGGEPEEKKSNKLLLIIGIVVVLIAGGVGYLYFSGQLPDLIQKVMGGGQ